ncbi:MAG: relaxase/mobilization nuclease domain-containing protein [Suipraeoptans sp.]
MIAKIKKSGSFSNTVNYILDNKKGATLIASEGVRTSNNQSMIDSFNMQAQLNNRVSKCTGHIILSFSEEDKNKISDEFMVKAAHEYMQKMGIVDTQYIIGRHFDKSHPHIHICYNRVDNEGKTISDKNDRLRSGKICKELTLKHGLFYANTDRQRVKIHRLKGSDKIKHEIFRTIGECLRLSSDWNEFSFYMKEAGIDIQFKTKGKSNEIQGITFTKDGYSFSGSKVAKKYSYSKLDAILSPKNSLGMSSSQKVNTTSLNNERAINVNLSILDAIPTNLYDTSSDESNNKRKRKIGR